MGLTRKCRVSKKVEDMVPDPKGFPYDKYEEANASVTTTCD